MLSPSWRKESDFLARIPGWGYAHGTYMGLLSPAVRYGDINLLTSIFDFHKKICTKVDAKKFKLCYTDSNRLLQPEPRQLKTRVLLAGNRNLPGLFWNISLFLSDAVGVFVLQSKGENVVNGRVRLSRRSSI